MKQLYDNLSEEVSKLTTTTYSTSFSFGIYLLSKHLRNPIYSVYGFVRLADEIVDSFEGFNKKNLLEKFTQETYEAIENKISLNPILNSFQKTFHEYAIDISHVNSFLRSMEMDLYHLDYSIEKYKQYIYGSAEVVGLMCLSVFTEGDNEKYESLKPFAKKLGAAFQKINFLRDLKDDYLLLGRTYFPHINMENFSIEAKKLIESEIENDFIEALEGIKNLPASSKGGVYLAYVYYRSLFNKIKKMPVQKILTERIRVNNGHKFGLMLNSMVECKMNLI